jgi:hypothetical protein
MLFDLIQNIAVTRIKEMYCINPWLREIDIKSKNGGQVIINFSSDEELDNMIEKIKV